MNYYDGCRCTVRIVFMSDTKLLWNMQAHDKDREKKLAINKLIEGNVQKNKMEEKMKVSD